MLEGNTKCCNWFKRVFFIMLVWLLITAVVNSAFTRNLAVLKEPPFARFPCEKSMNEIKAGLKDFIAIGDKQVCYADSTTIVLRKNFCPSGAFFYGISLVNDAGQKSMELRMKGSIMGPRTFNRNEDVFFQSIKYYLQ